MASPLAKGLFARAIGESGAMFPSPARAQAPLEKAEAAGLDFMRKAGARSLAELRALPADKILAAAAGTGLSPHRRRVVSAPPTARNLRLSRTKRRSATAGWNKGRSLHFTLLQGDDAKRPYAELVRAVFGGRTEAALRLYPDGSPEAEAASAAALGGDLTIIHPTWAWIEAQKQSGRADIFRFRFDRAPLTPEGRSASARAATPAPFMPANCCSFRQSARFSVGDRRFRLRAAKLASSYWINFVMNGDPNDAGLPALAVLSQRGRPVTILHTPPKAGPEEGRERHEFLKAATDGGGRPV